MEKEEIKSKKEVLLGSQEEICEKHNKKFKLF